MNGTCHALGTWPVNDECKQLMEQVRALAQLRLSTWRNEASSSANLDLQFDMRRVSGAHVMSTRSMCYFHPLTAFRESASDHGPSIHPTSVRNTAKVIRCCQTERLSGTMCRGIQVPSESTEVTIKRRTAKTLMLRCVRN